MTSMLAMVEMKGCILNFAVKKPAMVVKMVHSTIQTTRAQKNAGHHRQAGKVKDMTKYRAGVDALVHDDGGGRHAHTNHTADGQVGAGQQDQAGHAESQEHSGRGLLKDVQHVVHRQQLSVLDDGGDDTKGDEDDNDGKIQAVFQEEVPLIESVLIVLPLLGHGLAEGELGHAEHVDQVILVIERSVLPILDLLEVLGQGHLGVEETVFVNVLLVLDFVLVSELG